MSKSDGNLNNLIAILDTPDIIKKKIKRAVTDSGKDVKVEKSRPGISNLVNMYSLVTGTTVQAIEEQFEGKMYAEFKSELGDVTTDYLEPIQKKYAEISKDKTYLESVLANGAESAYYRARKTLTKVYRKVGLIPIKSG